MLDQMAPVITITSPADNSISNVADHLLTGTVDQPATVSVTVNGRPILPDVVTSATFTFALTLEYGSNEILVKAVDQVTNSSMAKRTVTFDNISPALAVISPAQDIRTNQSSLLLQGTVAEVMTGVTVTMTMEGSESRMEV